MKTICNFVPLPTSQCNSWWRRTGWWRGRWVCSGRRSTSSRRYPLVSRKSRMRKSKFLSSDSILTKWINNKQIIWWFRARWIHDEWCFDEQFSPIYRVPRLLLSILVVHLCLKWNFILVICFWLTINFWILWSSCCSLLFARWFFFFTPGILCLFVSGAFDL